MSVFIKSIAVGRVKLGTKKRRSCGYFVGAEPDREISVGSLMIGRATVSRSPKKPRDNAMKLRSEKPSRIV